MEGMRKFLAGVIYEVILIIILAGIVLLKQLTEAIFIAWGSMFTAGFVTYVIGNVVSKYAPAVPSAPVG